MTIIASDKIDKEDKELFYNELEKYDSLLNFI
jgi:hypothetical protein